MPEPTTPLILPDGSALPLLQPAPGSKAADWAAGLGLGPLAGLVVVAGGADALDESLQPALAQVLARGLVRSLRELAAQRGPAVRALCVVRAVGGGLPALLGQAVARHGQGPSGTVVQLLGLAPGGLLALPGQAAGAPTDVAAQSPVAGLTHLLATAGASWGEALRTRAELAGTLADALALRPILLVMGGGPGVLAEVADAVRLGWPVLLLEGSGGLADDLARQFRAGQADAGHPVVVDILADGRISVITLGDKPQQAAESLAAALQRECGGTSVLRLAWETFGALDRAAGLQQGDFSKLQGWILVLGVAVVAMSVLHALGTAHAWGWVVDGLHNALIVAPITVSALIAVGNRFSPGKRWVLLRAAAESLKREIYRYRVRPRQAVADGTREKDLQRAMEDITRRLARTEVNSMANPPYSGPIPPADAVAPGDDGLSLLGTDRYVRLRLTDQLAFYGNRTSRLARQANVWQVVAIVVGALGTLLAAVGGDYVSFVAVTSAVASAAMAFMGYKQFETTLTSYNQTAADLRNLLAWWTALQPDERADPINVDKLVTTTEKVLADEQDGWAQSMTNALAALRTTQDDKDDPGDKAEPGGKGDPDGKALPSAAAAAQTPAAETPASETPAETPAVDGAPAAESAPPPGR